MVLTMGFFNDAYGNDDGDDGDDGGGDVQSGGAHPRCSAWWSARYTPRKPG